MFEYKIDGDEENLLKTKHGYDEGRHSELNGETQKLAKKGFEVQDKSKEALKRIQAKVGEI